MKWIRPVQNIDDLRGVVNSTKYSVDTVKSQLLLLVSVYRSHVSALLRHRQASTVNTRTKVNRPHSHMQKLLFDNVNTVCVAALAN